MTEQEWRASVDKRLSHIETEVGLMKTNNAVADVHRSDVEARLASIESSLTWLVRLVIGAVIAAAAGVIFNGIN